VEDHPRSGEQALIAAVASEDESSIAGFPARWTAFVLDVEAESRGETIRLDAEPLQLHVLEEPERSIDAAALLRESVIVDPPYWALVWTGAAAIAATVATMPLAAGTRVLDLGCGLGAAGLAAVRRGVRVTFGDYLDEPLDFVRASLERLGQEADVRRIDFTDGTDTGDRYDLLLAADIVYDPAHYDPLAEWLDRHLAPGGTILLTESLRADAKLFLEKLRARGFADEKQALWVREEGRRERTWLHRLRRSA
jgi:predicted nicotinamide N-methyase